MVFHIIFNPMTCLFDGVCCILNGEVFFNELLFAMRGKHHEFETINRIKEQN